MIPAEFDYVAPDSLDAALAALRDGGEDAKLLAGGHSLLPLMKLRLAAPTLLVDLRRVPGLTRDRARQRRRADRGDDPPPRRRDAPELGLAAMAAATIADQQVRNRGTIGGTLAHGDPASDLPAVLLALEGSIVARGRERRARDRRRRPVPGLPHDRARATARSSPRSACPSLDGWGSGYAKFNRRVEDWAMVAVCAAVRKAPDGSCADVRVGLTNMGGMPLRATAAEAALRGGPLDAGAIAAAAEQAAEGTDPPADLNASADYKRHLARVLCRRALEEAAAAA